MIWLTTIWRAIANSRIVQALVLIGSAIGYHLIAKRRAGNRAVREEREDARQQARERAAEHAGDVSDALRESRDQQQQRREREQDENPRDRFSRDPFS